MTFSFAHNISGEPKGITVLESRAVISGGGSHCVDDGISEGLRGTVDGGSDAALLMDACGANGLSSDFSRAPLPGSLRDVFAKKNFGR